MNGLTIDSTYFARDVLSLALSGEVDMSSSRALDIALREAVEVPALSQLMVDLSKITFLDSTGIRTLVEGRHLATARNIGFRIVNPSEIARRVLEVTGVLQFLNAES